MSSRLLALSLLGLLVLACSNDPKGHPDAGLDAGAVEPKLAFLADCKRSEQCEQDACLEVAKKQSICTKPCDKDSDCPAGDNWTCGTTREVEDQLCLCLADGPELCGDGKDNDCDGKTDDCLMCDGLEVRPDNPMHCGACGVRCPASTLCEDGRCQCPDGRPASECSSPDAPECISHDDCDDRSECTADRCVEGRCQNRLAKEPCEAGFSCNLRLGRCEPGEACAKDGDCDDRDPCTSDERCDPALRVCLRSTLDGDRDGDPPVSCGGRDCDDSNDDKYRGAREECDGVDNDCDGQVDARLSTGACAEDRACVAGECTCNAGLTDCNGFTACVDLKTDRQRCGSCDHACDADEVCVSGTCVCPEGQTLCDGTCRDASWFVDDDLHCGSCDNVCPAWQVCRAGSCQCPPGTTLCGDGCVDLQDNPAHCNGCDQSCLVGQLCEQGVCQCPVGTELCSGQCVDTQSDLLHCGGCGEPCGASYGSCQGGACQCPNATDLICGGACAPVTSQLNCGSCGKACAVCAPGSCVQASKVFTAEQSSCALMDNGALYCWGDMYPYATSTPERVDSYLGEPLTGIVDLALDKGHFCALHTAKTLKCWGKGGSGQLGNGTQDSSSYPANVIVYEYSASLTNVIQTVVGLDPSTCALLSNGDAYCWGSSSMGQGGQGKRGFEWRAVPVYTNGSTKLTGVAELYGGRQAYCARRTNGELYCWGDNVDGQLGAPVPSYGYILYARRIDTADNVALSGVADVVMGSRHTCALLSGGTVSCWGANAAGQLGNGTLVASVRPVTVETSAGVALNNVTELSAGPLNTCARRSDGSVYCWGSNAFGQLGAGSNATEATRPVRVGATLTPAFTSAHAPQISPYEAGSAVMCAVAGSADSGALYCWGDGASGLLGNGSSTNRNLPTPVAAPASNVISFSVDHSHVCAVASGGLAYCWGQGTNGKLGTRSTEAALSPALVAF